MSLLLLFNRLLGPAPAISYPTRTRIESASSSSAIRSPRTQIGVRGKDTHSAIRSTDTTAVVHA